jgi:glyoxylase-like metal-dependent hydrolase (beta-lactamase superfamily II)
MDALPKMRVRGGFSEDSREGAELARSPRYSKLSDGEMIGDRLIALALRGHTKDSFGFFDIRTRTLLAGDCLQQRGIGKYRNGVGFPEEYRESIKKLSGMDIYRVVSSHEYDPLGDVAEGREAVCELFDLCLEAIR